MGQTSDLTKRLERHNQGRERFTSTGIPWNLLYSKLCVSRSEAMGLEKRIKNLGAKRYLAFLDLEG